MIKTEIQTFASATQEVDLAVAAGATHIILDDPAISIRSWVDPRPFDGFKHLESLIEYVKTAYPTIKISIQCDMVYHHAHDSMIEALENMLERAPVDFIRVQDIGLCYQLSKKHACTYESQIGNSSYASVQTVERWAARQCLNLELPAADIELISSETSTDFELLVHGHVCIQYSQRRFMAGLADEDEDSYAQSQIHRLAEDEDYPGRRFTFLDNPHGHFMFAYFDRSLLGDMAALIKCKLKAWLIDTRGQDPAYTQACIRAYAAALKQPAASLSADVKAHAPRPLKPGFFRANQTDKRRYQTMSMQLSDHHEVVGKILDIHNKQRITIECQAAFQRGQELELVHPKAMQIKVPSDLMWDVNNQEIEIAHTGELVQLPWVKGVQQNAWLVKA